MTRMLCLSAAPVCTGQPTALQIRLPVHGSAGMEILYLRSPSIPIVTRIFTHLHLIPPIPPGPFAETMEEYRSPVTSWQLFLLNSLLPGLSSGIIKPCNIITWPLIPELQEIISWEVRRTMERISALMEMMIT